MPSLFPDSFRRFFRVSKGTAEILCQHLGRCRELKKREYKGGREELATDKKVLMTLRYLASQENTMEISDRFGVTEYTFLKYRVKVIDCINNNLLNKFINWPSDAEMDTISDHFNDMGAHNFPGVIGAIDGSHISIEPPVENPNSYYNRKKFHSIVLQGICKDNLQFIHTNIGWPGRVHDAKVLRNSSIWEEGYQKCRYGRNHLLGDGAYPLKVWLITPYRDNGHLTRQQKYFNKCLSSKRQVIERAFGLLKGRFRRLKHINNRSVRSSCDTIQAACILHNLCIQNEDDIEEFLDQDDEDGDQMLNPLNVAENDAEGTLKRINITNTLSN